MRDAYYKLNLSDVNLSFANTDATYNLWTYGLLRCICFFMSELLRIFAANLRAQREKAGFSQEELAHRAGLHRTYVGSVERGERNICLKNIEKLAKALGVDPNKLLTHR